jgi:hypothetical protein
MGERAHATRAHAGVRQGAILKRGEIEADRSTSLLFHVKQWNAAGCRSVVKRGSRGRKGCIEEHDSAEYDVANDDRCQCCNDNKFKWCAGNMYHCPREDCSNKLCDQCVAQSSSEEYRRSDTSFCRDCSLAICSECASYDALADEHS